MKKKWSKLSSKQLHRKKVIRNNRVKYVNKENK